MASTAAHKRAAKVCRLCHQCKVRCEMPVKGEPCLRCRETGETCELRSRKPYSTRRMNATPQRARKLSSSAPLSDAIFWEEDNASENGSLKEDTKRSDMIIEKAFDHINGTANTAALFVGDQHGIAALLGTNRSATLQKRHFMVPRAVSKSLEPEDLHYLKMKGCFSLPDVDICEALVQCYFEFVHLSFPIVDAKTFLDAYIEGGIQAINLLLIWSMFSVATSVSLPFRDLRPCS